MAASRWDPDDDCGMQHTRYGGYVLYEEYNALEDRISELESELNTTKDNLDTATEDLKSAQVTIVTLRNEAWDMASTLTELKLSLYEG